MKLHRIFISLPLIGLGLIAFVPLFWSAVQLVSGDVPAQQAPRLATTPYATMPAATPMTTPLVSDHVLLQDARVDTEAARLDLALTQEAAQAEADRIAGIIFATDSQRALELARIAQQQELERQDVANERLRLALLEEEGEATRTARQAEIVMGLNATATAYSQDMAAIIQIAQAQATATVVAANAAAIEATARRDENVAGLVVIALGALLFMGIIAVCAAVYPTLARAVLQERASEARVTISDNPMPPLTIAPPTAEVLPPPERAPIRAPRPQNNVIDTSMTVIDSVTPREVTFLSPTAAQFTEAEKDHICAEFGVQKNVSATARAVFGADTNPRRNRKIKAVLIERHLLQEEMVTA